MCAIYVGPACRVRKLLLDDAMVKVLRVFPETNVLRRKEVYSQKQE